jgi:hypothetical protein
MPRPAWGNSTPSIRMVSAYHPRPTLPVPLYCGRPGAIGDRTVRSVRHPAPVLVGLRRATITYTGKPQMRRRNPQ